MTFPTLATLADYLVFVCAGSGALLAALWVSLVIWAFRDMRSRSRDPFAQIFAALVVAILPGVGLLIYVILRPPETLSEAYERALEEEALLQEIEERPKCPGCSRQVDSSWILCAHCHTRLKKKCRDCEALLELQWNLCPYCGNHHVDLYHVEPPQSSYESEPEYDALAEPVVRSEPYELTGTPTFMATDDGDYLVEMTDPPEPPVDEPTVDLAGSLVDSEKDA
ncbi:MAG: zinc ribbon domain-containing protein [Anaerolineales bacterium]|nr:zinc ribbon domain-containing protein [Anaerolineales bacterium]